MFDQFLPRKADNSYRGLKPALWIFTLALLLLAAMSTNSTFNGRYVAMDLDGLPLDAYTEAGAQAVVSFYAIWGVTQLILVLICIIVLLRYRALVPLMFSVLLLQMLLLRVVHHYLPVSKPGEAPASWFIILLYALMALGLILSLWRRRAHA